MRYDKDAYLVRGGGGKMFPWNANESTLRAFGCAGLCGSVEDEEGRCQPRIKNRTWSEMGLGK